MLISPGRLLVSLVGYVLLYRVVLEISGSVVLGLWSLLTASASFLTLLDLGFSQALIRGAGRDRTGAELDSLRGDCVAARRIYGVISVTALLVAVPLAVTLSPGSVSYSAEGLGVAIALIVGAIGIGLAGKLDAAVLTARQDNAYVQVVSVAVALITFAVALPAAGKGRPLEGYAGGQFAAAVFQVLAFRWRLKREHPEWSASRRSVNWRATLPRLRAFAGRGSGLYAISVGLALREPVFRFVIAGLMGLSVVAVYDIAMRITSAARELIAQGFSVLYPSFAALHRSGERRELVELLRLALLTGLLGGGLLLSLTLFLAPRAFAAGLVGGAETLITTAFVLVLWHLVTLANAPFWLLLQATGNERFGAASLWLHTGLVLLLIPISLVVNLNFETLMIYWLISALPTQVLIYRGVQRRTGLLWEVIWSFRVALVVALTVLFVVAFARASAGTLAPIQADVFAVILTGSYVALGAVLFWSPLRVFLRMRLRT